MHTSPLLKSSVQKEEVPCLLSQRWILAYIGFFGFVFVYSLRINLSVAIVCMVKSENLNITLLDGGNLSSGTQQDCIDNTAINAINEHAEFEWSKSSQSTILASFFYGYIVTQIPAGWLADRFGGRRVFGISMFIAAVCTLVLPVCARTSVVLVYILRVLLGLATGVSFPAVHSMWGRWAPPLERSKLISVTYLGTMFGNIATLSSSGWLCQEGFDNGWGSIFYITGGLTLFWVFAWFYLTADTPEQHKRITEAEKNYIISSIEYNTNIRTSEVPWRSISRSPAVWACLTAHVCNNWTNYTLLTSLPTFMKEVLKFNIKSGTCMSLLLIVEGLTAIVTMKDSNKIAVTCFNNGALSAVPYICQAVSGFIAGQTADIIRSKGILNTTHTRKAYQLTAFIGAGVLSVATGFMSCEKRDLAVTFLSLAVMFTGLCRAGYGVNHVDFAPKYAGVLLGITNTWDGSTDSSRTINSKWFDLFGAIIFGLFSRGTIQSWASDPPKEIQRIVKDGDIQLHKSDETDEQRETSSDEHKTDEENK